MRVSIVMVVLCVLVLLLFRKCWIFVVFVDWWVIVRWFGVWLGKIIVMRSSRVSGVRWIVRWEVSRLVVIVVEMVSIMIYRVLMCLVSIVCIMWVVS